MTHVVQPRAFQQQPLVELLLRVKRLSAYLKARVGILCGRFQLRKTAQNDILHAGFPRGIIRLVVSRVPKLLATIQLFDTSSSSQIAPDGSSTSVSEAVWRPTCSSSQRRLVMLESNTNTFPPSSSIRSNESMRAGIWSNPPIDVASSLCIALFSDCASWALNSSHTPAKPSIEYTSNPCWSTSEPAKGGDSMNPLRMASLLSNVDNISANSTVDVVELSDSDAS